jgi:hypothetical protein
MNNFNHEIITQNFLNFWRILSKIHNINIEYKIDSMTFNILNPGIPIYDFFEIFIKDNFQFANSISIINNYITRLSYSIVYTNITQKINISVNNNHNLFQHNHLQQYKENL